MCRGEECERTGTGDVCQMVVVITCPPLYFAFLGSLVSQLLNPGPGRLIVLMVRTRDTHMIL
jgi:hypothetical protein